jgi:SUMO ligase MMS21 Smc5/6 complex component
MKWNITLPLLASLFVIQNALCSEIARDIEDVLKRLQHMESKGNKDVHHVYEVYYSLFLSQGNKSVICTREKTMVFISV